MLDGEIPGATEVLAEVRSAGLPVYALSNWSAETFSTRPRAVRVPRLVRRHRHLRRRRRREAGPADLRPLVARYGIEPAASVYVDDMPVNVAAAAGLGFQALQFRDAGSLREDLVRLGVLPSG